jgi:hypothetical protein
MNILVVLGVLLVLAIAAFVISIYVLLAKAVYRMAEKRGRNAMAWMIYSHFCFPFTVMLILACLGETDDQEDWRIYQEEIIREKARKGEPLD